MILDTSVLIDMLEGNESVKTSLQKLDGKAATTVICKYELLRGLGGGQVNSLLNTLDVYPFDGDAPERSSVIYKELRRNGKLINELDILIAAIAISNDELLVTRDNDFKAVENLKLLVI